jgi:hypothetical protein
MKTGHIIAEVPLPITGRGGLEDYFLKDTKPFYERRFLGLF